MTDAPYLVMGGLKYPFWHTLMPRGGVGVHTITVG